MIDLTDDLYFALALCRTIGFVAMGGGFFVGIIGMTGVDPWWNAVLGGAACGMMLVGIAVVVAVVLGARRAWGL